MLHFFYRTVVLFIKYLLSYCFTFIRIHLDIERNFSAMQLSSQTLSLSEKLNLLADAAKYDVACKMCIRDRIGNASTPRPTAAGMEMNIVRRMVSRILSFASSRSPVA